MTSPNTGTGEGKLYVCAFKDVWSNRIVGYSIDSRMKSRLAVAALNNAVARRGHVAGCVVHTDRGSQFRSRKFVRALAHHRMVGSMGRVGAAGDNAAMESFFSLLQKNVLNRHTWATRQELRIAIVTWTERTYHRRRRQDALGRLTPVGVRDHHDHASHSGCVTNHCHQFVQQTPRMITVGTVTPKQEEVLQMCVDAVRRAEQLIKPGASFDSLHEAAFAAYVGRGYLSSTKTRTMPFNWEALPDGSPRPVPRQYVPDRDWEAQGRRLMHVYPATVGPHNPNLGHAIGMPKLPQYNVSSHNTDRMEAGMVFVLHAQWLDPLVAGCNVGDLYVVTHDGAENLSCHTPLEPFRIPA